MSKCSERQPVMTRSRDDAGDQLGSLRQWRGSSPLRLMSQHGMSVGTDTERGLDACSKRAPCECTEASSLLISSNVALLDRDDCAIRTDYIK